MARLDASAGTSASGTQQTQTNATQQDFQAAVLAYTKCLRSQGLNVPDPTFGSGGAGGGALLRQAGINQNSTKFRKAQDKCRSKLDAVRPQFSAADRQKFQDAALKFAQCMRENGVNVPDPNFSNQGPGAGGGPGSGQGGGLFGASGIDPSSPKVQQAMTTCRKVFTDAGLGQGRFGRPGGRGPPPTNGSGS